MTLVGAITHRSLFRALDVAGGDGRLATSRLFQGYPRVDLFDRCPEAVKRAKRALAGRGNRGHVS